ncbi:MAG: glycosyltransferase family 9 protein [Planctomycetes bacterium]|nr:glycosyltransferase family 9 protein [Planctomycetota bacterium]
MIPLDPNTIRKILIIRTSALGDVIHVLPSLAALKELFPRARISWLVEPLGAALLQGHPLLHRLFVLERKRWRKRLRSPAQWPVLLREAAGFLGSLRRERFDLVIDFQGNFRSGFLALASGSGRRLSFHPSDCREPGGWIFATHRAPPAPALENKVLKNLHLVRGLGWSGGCPPPLLPIPQEDLRWAEQLLETLPATGPVILFHPAVSAFGMLKQWPAEHFRALWDRLREHFDARIIITWGPGERPFAEAIDRATIAPPTEKLFQLAALVARSALVVAADTGCLHLAAACGTPLVGLYGPKNPRVYGPYPIRGRIVQSRVPCSPCKLRRCEHRICMATLFPEEVFEACLEALKEGRSPAHVPS